jgi:hypothetical protein
MRHHRRRNVQIERMHAFPWQMQVRLWINVVIKCQCGKGGLEMGDISGYDEDVREINVGIRI